MIVGIDEAGRGPLAGMVVACALYLKNKPDFKVRDSKLISASKREEIFSWLIDNAEFAVGIADSEEIDEINILNATMLAFDRAIKKLLNKFPHLVKANFIVDGNLFKTDLKIKYTCIVKADRTILEVSSASIVAKVVRDHLMQGVDFLYPEWGFAKHKGYPTSEHFALIKKHSLTPFHRISFSPCSKEQIKQRVSKVKI
tara:strand:- start:1235 stop:1831 length:597 start_codon:yes stop_codon:yes gene_type:complete